MKYVDFLAQWLETYKKRQLKSSTYTNYCYNLRHLQPLYDKKVQQITAFDVQKIVNAMADKGLSQSTVKHVITLLNQSMNKAIQLGYRADNPALCLDLPRFERERVESLNDIEIAQLLYHRSECIYSDVFLFLLNSGLRVGELLALKYSDINFQDGFINIARSSYRGTVTTPKTSAGRRSIPLNDELRRILRRTRTRKGLIFRNTNGSIIDYGCLLKSWHRLQSVCGYRRRYGLHVFRHTFATRLLRNHVDVKTISALLGHANVNVTLNVYCDADVGLMQSAMESLDGFIFA